MNSGLIFKLSVLVVLLFVGCTLFSFVPSQDFDLKASIKRGSDVYGTHCASCHMAEGEGLEGVFPPIAKADNLKDKNRLVKVVLQGVRGPMKIKGVAYNGEMPGTALKDQQVADVLNFIRNSWGNKGEAIRPQEVQTALKSPVKNYQKY